MSESAPEGEADSGNGGTDKEFSCDVCDYTTHKSSSFTEHLRRCDPDELVECPSCDRRFLNEKGVMYHHTRKHDESLAKETVECVTCGASKRVHSSRLEKYEDQFCSIECHNKHKETTGGKDHPLAERVEIECAYCGDIISKLPSRARRGGNHFCDQECYGEYRSEHYRRENNPRWNGGTVDDYGPDWPRMRRKALKEYNHECFICGRGESEIGRNPDVHHVKQVRSFENPNDAHYMDNLVVLCRKCHKEWEGIPLRPH